LNFIETYAYRRKKIAWSKIRADAERRAGEATSMEDAYQIIIDTLTALEDHHSSFSRPVVAAKQATGNVVSFGFVALWPSRIVATVVASGPAARAGLRVGDRIDLVDNAAPAHRDTQVIIPRNQVGDLPKTIQLVIRRRGVRNAIRLKLASGDVTLVSIPTAAVVTAPPKVGVPLGPELGLLDVPGLIGDDAVQAAYAQKLQDAVRAIDVSKRCGWIVDLRRNRGGYIYAMLAGLGPLYGPVSENIGGRIDASGTKSTWAYQNGSAVIDGKTTVTLTTPYQLQLQEPAVAVLTSSLTASAGEATAISFRGQPNTRSFGEATAGLTSFNVRLVLSDGAFLDVTNSVDIDRNSTEYTGPVQPDERISVDWNHINDPSDPVLRAAQAWLTAQPTCRS
jgi:carboxyl-terminal processing protease